MEEERFGLSLHYFHLKMRGRSKHQKIIKKPGELEKLTGQMRQGREEETLTKPGAGDDCRPINLLGEHQAQKIFTPLQMAFKIQSICVLGSMSTYQHALAECQGAERND